MADTDVVVDNKNNDPVIEDEDAQNGITTNSAEVEKKDDDDNEIYNEFELEVDNDNEQHIKDNEFDLEPYKVQVRENEEEFEKIRQIQTDTSFGSPTAEISSTDGLQFPTFEEKIESDSRSIYVGNVDYSATAEQLQEHFFGCGAINRVSIMYDKFSGRPKGFAYIEFTDKDAIETALQLNESLFKGRSIHVNLKRTNRPGLGSGNRQFRGRGNRSQRARGTWMPRGGYFRPVRGPNRFNARYSPY